MVAALNSGIFCHIYYHLYHRFHLFTDFHQYKPYELYWSQILKFYSYGVAFSRNSRIWCIFNVLLVFDLQHRRYVFKWLVSFSPAEYMPRSAFFRPTGLFSRLSCLELLALELDHNLPKHLSWSHISCTIWKGARFFNSIREVTARLLTDIAAGTAVSVVTVYCVSM